jgi:ATP-binding cassette subfamily B protein
MENIVYGNTLYNYDFSSLQSKSHEDDNASSTLFTEFEEVLKQKNLYQLINIFPEGLQTKVTNNSENISLGQKQIINFMRIILREPSFLILDEATANLDTVTESILQKILDSISKDTTVLIIAHRLNTIKDADQIFLVGGGRITTADASTIH